MILASASLSADSMVPCEGTNKIDASAVQIDAQLKRMKVRAFAETYSQQGSIWSEVKPGSRSPGSTAAVYVGDGVPVVAFFTIQTQSGDWVLYADYYFRHDGSLAKMHERLNTFHTHASVIRDAYFGCRGEAYGGATRHVNLKTQKPTQADPDLNDRRAPLFMRAQSLPFFSALKPRD